MRILKCFSDRSYSHDPIALKNMVEHVHVLPERGGNSFEYYIDWLGWNAHPGHNVAAASHASVLRMHDGYQFCLTTRIPSHYHHSCKACLGSLVAEMSFSAQPMDAALTRVTLNC